MKKMKLFIATLSISLMAGLSLSSCGDQPSGQPSEVSTPVSEVSDPVANVKRIILNTALIDTTDFVVGQYYNLDDFVTVESTELKANEYDIQVMTPETALVENHELAVLKEGTLTLKITAGSKSANFDVIAMSAVKKDLKDYIDKIGMNYYADYMYIDAETGGIGLIGQGAFHNEKYFATCESPNLYGDDATGEWSGLLTAGTGDTYEFTIDPKLTSIEVHPGKRSPITDMVLGQPFPVKAANFVTGTSQIFTKIGDIAYCEETDVVSDFCRYTIGINSPKDIGALTMKDGSVSEVVSQRLEAIPLQTKAFDAYMFFVTFELKNGYSDIWVYEAVLDEKATDAISSVLSMKLIEDYIASTEVPTPYTYAELTDKLVAISTSQNYTLDASIYWSNTTSSLQTTIINGDGTGNYMNVLDFVYEVAPAVEGSNLVTLNAPAIKEKFVYDPTKGTLQVIETDENTVLNEFKYVAQEENAEFPYVGTWYGFDGGKKVDTPATFSKWGWDKMLPVSYHSKAYVTNTAYYTVIDNFNDTFKDGKKLITGNIIHEEKNYSFTNAVTSGEGTNYVDTITASSNPTDVAIWDDTNLASSLITNVSSTSNLNVTTKEITTVSSYFELTGNNGNEDFLGELSEMFPRIGSDLREVLTSNQMLESGIPVIHLFSDAIFFITEDVFYFDTYIYWEQGKVYHISIFISDIGSTVLPEEANGIVYPTAA